MKRLSVFLTLIAGLFFGGLNVAVAQEASPVAPPVADILAAADLGLPELVITYDGSAFQLPAETAAGRYLVTFTNSDAENTLSAGFLLDPGGMTLADFQTQIDKLNAEDAPPDVFSWVYDKTFAGGVVAMPGQTSQAIVDLKPGHWFLGNEDSNILPTPTAEITVTGDMPTDLPEPNATATFTAVGTADGYDFQVTGQVTTGTQIIKFINKTDQVHFLGTFQMNMPINFDQFMEVAMAPEGATPVPGSDLDGIAYVGDGPQSTIISDGQTTWLIWNFTPGHWNAVCWMPEERSAEGIPHAMEGMFEPFEVAA